MATSTQTASAVPLTTTAIGALSPAPDASVPQITSVPQVTPATYAASQRTVNKNETVADQFKGLIQDGSPIIDMARTRAKEQMNGMGLLNSSMALGAADAAAYQAALPIAQADATTYGTAARENTAATNAALATNAAATNDVSKLNLSANIEALKANMDAANKTRLAGVEADYKTLIQTSASAADAYKSALAQIGEVMRSTTMDATAKSNAINGIYGSMETAMNLIGSINGVQLSGTNADGTKWDLLDFGEAEAEKP